MTAPTPAADRIRTRSRDGVTGILGFAGIVVPWRPSALDRLALMILTAATRRQAVSLPSLLDLIDECDRVAVDVDAVRLRADALMSALARRRSRIGTSCIALCEVAISLGIERASLLEVLRARAGGGA